MLKSTKELLQKYEETWKMEDEHREYRYREEAKRKREEIISKFNALPLEEQYEVLLEAAKSIGADGEPETNYNFFFKFNENSRILEILNNQFPHGIKNPNEFNYGDKKHESVMPFELYSNLLTFIPGYQAYSKLVEGTTIFKDEMGRIDRRKIIEYWLNPKISRYYKEENLNNVFDFLDPDKDREGIIKIIETIIKEQTVELTNPDYTRNPLPPNIATARFMYELIEEEKAKAEKDNISNLDAIQRIIGSGTIGDSNRERNMQEVLSKMKESFERIVNSKYGRNDMTYSDVERIYATCILAAYNSITERARTELDNVKGAMGVFKKEEKRERGE